MVDWALKISYLFKQYKCVQYQACKCTSYLLVILKKKKQGDTLLTDNMKFWNFTQKCLYIFREKTPPPPPPPPGQYTSTVLLHTFFRWTTWPRPLPNGRPLNIDQYFFFLVLSVPGAGGLFWTHLMIHFCRTPWSEHGQCGCLRKPSAENNMYEEVKTSDSLFTRIYNCKPSVPGM